MPLAGLPKAAAARTFAHGPAATAGRAAAVGSAAPDPTGTFAASAASAATAAAAAAAAARRAVAGSCRE